MRGIITAGLLVSLASVSAQGVTAIISAPGSSPSGCALTQNGVFGIQVVQGVAMKKRQVTQLGDGQVQAGTIVPATPVTAIADGQIQAPAGVVTVTVTKNNCVASPVTQIGDGQIQAPMATPITAIADGQIQAPAAAATPVTAITDGQIQAPIASIAANPVTAIGDGQIQAPAGANPVTAIGDGQIQAPNASPVIAIGDGQIQAGTTLATSIRTAGMSTGTNSAGLAILSGAPQSCSSVSGVLKLTLANGILKDGQGRTGYIASNSQFQFDAPPQNGAEYTAGFSVCSSGLLALGGDTTFYRCLSGSFYNLYYKNVLGAAQCEAVQIEVIQLNSC